MAAAQILRLTHSVDDRVKVVDDKITGVRDDMKDMKDKMNIVLNGTPDVLAPQNLTILMRKTFLRRQGCESSHRRREMFVIDPFTPGEEVSDLLSGNQLRESLRRWVAPPDPSTNHNIACDIHHGGTAEWFFRGSIFTGWKCNGSLLWIYGKRMFLHLFPRSTLDSLYP